MVVMVGMAGREGIGIFMGCRDIYSEVFLSIENPMEILETFDRGKLHGGV